MGGARGDRESRPGIDGLPSLNGASQTLPALYNLPASNFHDITTGNNGFAAAPGYDLVTGLGSPVANQLVPDLAALAVTSATPQAGGAVNTPPTSFMFTFDNTVGSASAAGFMVNGIAATSAAVSGGSVTYTFATSPVTSPGTQTMAIAAGSVTSATGADSVYAYTNTFYFSATALTVTSITPANGSVVSLPVTSIVVQFSTAVDASTLGVGNLVLSAGTVTGYSQVNSTTVQYTLSGITTEQILTITINKGAVTDAYGDPVAAYSGDLSLDYPGPVAFPTLVGLSPNGSLEYGAETSGLINSAGNTDVFTLSLDAGQTLSLGVSTDANLQVGLTLTGPSGSTVGSVSSTAAGNSILLQTVAIPTTGQYTITISGVGGSTGAFQAVAILNAAIQSDLFGGASPGSLAAAESLTSSVESLGNNASRTAVLGALNSASPDLSDWYSITLAAGDSVTLSAADLDGASNIALSLYNSSSVLQASAAAGQTPTITDQVMSTSGVYYIELYGASALTSYTLVVTRNAELDNLNNNTIATAQPLSSASQGGVKTALGQVQSAVNVENFQSGSLAAYAFTGISTAQVTTAAAYNGSAYGLDTGEYTQWIYRDDAAAQVAQGDQISLWFQAGSDIENGIAWFGFGASSAGTMSVVMAGGNGSGGIYNDFALEDNTGFGGLVIAESSYTWTPSTWYQLDITWGFGGNITANLYSTTGTLDSSVSATDNAITAGGIAFQSEDTDTYFDTVSIVGAPSPTYSLTLNAGATLTASTATPGAGGGEPNNALVPELLLYNALGTLVASAENNASDSINAILDYAVPAGASGTYYLQVVAASSTAQPTSGDYILTASMSPAFATIANPPAIPENAGKQTINLTGVEPGSTNETGETLTLTATSSNPSLIPNPTVSYTSPNSTGSLSYTPAAHEFGSAVITVTLTDNGGSGGVQTTSSQNFTVNVLPPPPVVTTSSGATTATAGWATAIDAGIALSDEATTPTLSSLVSISAGLQTGDTLALGSTEDGVVSSSYNAATGVLSIVGGAATAAQFQAALQSVTLMSARSRPADRSRRLSEVARSHSP